MLILGDLNCSTTRIACLKEQIEKGWLIDVGNQGHKDGKPTDDYTCKAHGATIPTRRAYVFANPEAFELIEDFEVDHEANFDVHFPIKMTMKCEDDYKNVITTKNIKSLVEIKQKMLKDLFLTENRNERNNKNAEKKKGTC